MGPLKFSSFCKFAFIQILSLIQTGMALRNE